MVWHKMRLRQDHTDLRNTNQMTSELMEIFSWTSEVLNFSKERFWQYQSFSKSKVVWGIRSTFKKSLISYIFEWTGKKLEKWVIKFDIFVSLYETLFISHYFWFQKVILKFCNTLEIFWHKERGFWFDRNAKFNENSFNNSLCNINLNFFGDTKLVFLQK